MCKLFMLGAQDHRGLSFSLSDLPNCLAVCLFEMTEEQHTARHPNNKAYYSHSDSSQICAHRLILATQKQPVATHERRDPRRRQKQQQPGECGFHRRYVGQVQANSRIAAPTWFRPRAFPKFHQPEPVKSVGWRRWRPT